MACVVLHNLCIEQNIPLIDEDEMDGYDLGVYNIDLNEDAVQNRQHPELVAGLRFRQNIVNRLFTNQAN